jgi:hypothetical protein
LLDLIVDQSRLGRGLLFNFDEQNLLLACLALAKSLDKFYHKPQHVKEIGKMTCTIILTPQKNRVRAQVAEFPNCEFEAKGRDEVLALVRKEIERIFKRCEILQLEVSNRGSLRQGQKKESKPPNLVRFDAPNFLNDQEPVRKSAAEYYGIFKDDPTLWPMMEEIEKRRDQQRGPTNKRRKK